MKVPTSPRTKEAVMRKLASPLAREHAHRKVLVDNTDRLARIVYRLGSYGRLSAHMLRHGVQPIDIIRTQFPLIRPNPTRPVLFTIELTNHCNLRCNYCTNRLGLRERGFMTEETFARVVDGIRRLGINRVRVVGGGEPTLHPTFGAFLRKAAQATHYLSVLSNGQWRHPLRTIREMLDAPVDLIEVSVEGTDGDRYKASTDGTVTCLCATTRSHNTALPASYWVT
jgi:pyruvate-formate lyase-activating enzyme